MNITFCLEPLTMDDGLKMEQLETLKSTLSDILCDTSTRVEALVSAKVDELKALMRELVGERATKQSVHDKFQATNEVLSCIERPLHDEHRDALGVVTAHTARIEALEGTVKSWQPT